MSEASNLKDLKINNDMFGTKLNERKQMRMFDYQKAKFEVLSYFINEFSLPGKNNLLPFIHLKWHKLKPKKKRNCKS